MKGSDYLSLLDVLNIQIIFLGSLDVTAAIVNLSTFGKPASQEAKVNPSLLSRARRALGHAQASDRWADRLNSAA